MDRIKVEETHEITKSEIRRYAKATIRDLLRDLKDYGLPDAFVFVAKWPDWDAVYMSGTDSDTFDVLAFLQETMDKAESNDRQRDAEESGASNKC